MANRTRRLRRRFWVALAVAVAGVLGLVATLVWPAWIELVLGVDPDGGDGSIERALAMAASVVSAGGVILAGFEWRRVAARGCAPHAVEADPVVGDQ